MSSSENAQILIVISDQQVRFSLERILSSAGYLVTAFSNQSSAKSTLKHTPDLIILSDVLEDGDGFQVATQISQTYPMVSLLLLAHQEDIATYKRAMLSGASSLLCLPIRNEEFLSIVRDALQRTRAIKEAVVYQTRRDTASLKQRVDEVEVLARLGRTITSMLDLDNALSAIVDAAVHLTGADEGSLLLLDDQTGELYMRASRNFKEDFVRTFRLPITDTLPGTVLRSGQPVLINEETPKKIKTAYLVHSLIYVPLQSGGRVIGVLGVDNRVEHKGFKQRDVKLLNALAEYAMIALENARLYSVSLQEKSKIETILTNIEDGVIVLDSTEKVILVNHTAQTALHLKDPLILGRPYANTFKQTEMLDFIKACTGQPSASSEIPVEDGRIFSALYNTIPGVGSAITLHDITYLKKMDRIKNDFVSTVSHDLRSPLTAIMGYAELVERAGPMTDLQREFTHRIQASVQNITKLVDDLLNLGRIESGFDTRRENIQFDQLIQFVVETFNPIITSKNQNLVLEIPEDFPIMFANPIQIRQLFENLIENAVKYSPIGGTITVHGEVAQNQIIIQVSDTGIGIPERDVPHIFEKFYRASNITSDMRGTGLGLSIVRSIVESHHGRIWVDTIIGQGTTFTVVFPYSG